MKFWLPEPVDVRTGPKIKIPHNPLILQNKPKTFPLPRKPRINVFGKAQQFETMLKEGIVSSKSELANKEGITRARVTQVLNLLKLAPEIQEFLLSLTDAQAEFFTEKRLREITRIRDQETQLTKFQELKKKGSI